VVTPAATRTPLDPATRALERRIIFLVGAIQFVNVLDFMMVMPLGPDFARELGVPTAQIGLIGGSYTAAAAVAGIVGSLFLDRFDRRKALAFAMLGLGLGTLAGGFATGLVSLLAARVLAGAFGGPATAISLAIVTDAVPAERRGKALGAVMGAFSLASVLGVPAGLELARLISWRAPFFAVAGLGLCITVLASRVMPPQRQHLLDKARSTAPATPMFDLSTCISLVNTALLMFGVFSVVPNISAYVQHNLGYPRERLGLLYLVGGCFSFVAMRVVGRLVDKWGPLPLVTLGTAIHAIALFEAFISPHPAVAVLPVFTLFMVSGSVRAVPMQQLATRVPRPEQRARFMSAQSAVQHMASAAGAILASMFLVALPSGKLVGMDKIALLAMTLALLVPFGARLLELRLKGRTLIAPPAQAALEA